MSVQHEFKGKWITDAEFAQLLPRNVFHRQLEPVDLPCDDHRDRHILFRRAFNLETAPVSAKLYVTADDYYKLWVNGVFVTQGPAPAYPQRYGYHCVDVAPYLRNGRNVFAFHTLYQGLINRVWVSADNRHGLICDLEIDGRILFGSDERFLTHSHTGFSEMGTVGYSTQFLEQYDSASSETGFEQPDYDDSGWSSASLRACADWRLCPQATKRLVFERIEPAVLDRRGDTLFVDFGGMYAGYLGVRAKGRPGDVVRIRCGQELNEDGSVRFRLRANCDYEEKWALSGKEDSLDWFDYKSFRYAELLLPDGCSVADVFLTARHYPFACKARLAPDLASDEKLRQVWNLCVRSQKYGAQEVIQDCMEREKGFYVGDGCYTALCNMILTGDDSMVRKLIDDAFFSTFITPGTVTCLDCSMMQEIAEYPLMLISLLLWYARLTGDRAYLAQRAPDAFALLDCYRRDYERDGLLCDLDKWCVVEWPANFRDGYDVDITEGRVCHEPHVALNAYYIEAIRCANTIAEIAGLPPYRDEKPLTEAFLRAFYDPKRGLFTDSLHSRHTSYIGNILPFAFRLCPDEPCRRNILAWIDRVGVTGVSFFGAFPLMYGLIRYGERARVVSMLQDENAWLRMIREGATSTFEGWGKDSKWNTSLFHLTFSDAAVFLSDVDLGALFA